MNAKSQGGPSASLPPDLVALVTRLVEEGREPDAALLRSDSSWTDEDIDRAHRAWTQYVGLLRDGRGMCHRGPRLEAGTRLGDFVIEDVIAYGGMSVVYRGRQSSLADRTIAVKVFAPPLGEDHETYVSRFRREARLAAQVTHRHLAQVIGAGEDHGVMFYAMRFIEGQTLHQAIIRLVDAARDSTFDWTTHARMVARIGAETADVLSAIHGRGLARLRVMLER